MKELSIEEKAKAYDVAIERAKSFIENGDETERTISESIFAGIMDVSEDENIRKELIECLKHNALGYSEQTRNKWFAWLEKQGEQKSNPYSGTSFKYNGHIWGMCARDNGVDILLDNQFLKHFENQGEQKLDDKVEPKFKVGDWIVKYGNVNTINQVIKVEQIDDEYFGYTLDDKSYFGGSWESSYRLWTIQDAKPGDVLAFNDGHGNDCIELIKSITDKKIEFWFCLTNGNSYEVFDGITPYTNFASREDATPATKEQHDQLEKAITAAGYEWDAEKKELKKIEQKSDEDSCKISDDITTEENDMTEYNKGFECGKQRVLKYPEDYGLCKNLAWSEEDENMLQKALSTIRYALSIPADKEDDPCFAGSSTIAWLKSIKERMKGE